MVALMGNYSNCHANCLFYRFSRKIIWLRVSPTDHDPKVVAKFYLQSLEEVAGNTLMLLFN